MSRTVHSVGMDGKTTTFERVGTEVRVTIRFRTEYDAMEMFDAWERDAKAGQVVVVVECKPEG